MHTVYRPDIDGLRALAVLCVVVFHAFPSAMPGGFVGVDVFFVISGFLISSIILRSRDRRVFDYAEFYGRRIRRIIPSLCLVIAFCILAGWFLLLPDEYMLLGKHIAGSATFTSNFLLYRESGYFDTAAELKPLLHLWSLAIEEQFYILWPLTMVMIYRMRRNQYIVIGVLVAVSFLINVYLTQRNSNAAFYNPLPRFWELMIGGGLAWSSLGSEVRTARFSNLKSLLGGAMLVGGLFLISKDRGFPGVWVLMPCLGAALLISCGSGAWFNSHVLANRGLVWVGLISYPLYLWHWPLLSFLRIYEGQTPTWMARVSAIILSILLAWFSYRFVEIPIRKNKLGSVLGLLASFLGLCAIGFTAYASKGYEVRIVDKPYFERYKSFVKVDNQTALPTCPEAYISHDYPLNLCRRSNQGVPNIAIFGDSHAEDKFGGLARLDRNNNWLLVGHRACPPVNGVSVEGSVANCQHRTEFITRTLAADKSIETVVLAFFGNSFLPAYAADHVARNLPPNFTKFSVDGVVRDDRASAFFTGLEKTISQLASSGKQVVVLIDNPELPFMPRSCLRALQAAQCQLPKDSVLSRQADLRSGLDQISKRFPEVLFFDPIDLFCANSNCRFDSDSQVYYQDSHHLSVDGGVYYASRLLTWLANGSRQ